MTRPVHNVKAPPEMLDMIEDGILRFGVDIRRRRGFPAWESGDVAIVREEGGSRIARGIVGLVLDRTLDRGVPRGMCRVDIRIAPWRDPE